METHFLFAYGTLKSNQPDHALHCDPPPISIRNARVPGYLWLLKEGYAILQIAPQQIIANASLDCVRDWTSVNKNALESETPLSSIDNWIEGELMEFELKPHSLHKMDLWENFSPGTPSSYQRRIIQAQDESGNGQICWAYVCNTPPNGAVRIAANKW